MWLDKVGELLWSNWRGQERQCTYENRRKLSADGSFSAEKGKKEEPLMKSYNVSNKSKANALSSRISMVAEVLAWPRLQVYPHPSTAITSIDPTADPSGLASQSITPPAHFPPFITKSGSQHLPAKLTTHMKTERTCKTYTSRTQGNFILKL